MSRKSVNKVTLVGNLGADPEGRFTPNGTAVSRVSVATTEAWKDKQSGEYQERTEWHRVVLYGKLAEIANDYLRKGAQVYVEGRNQTRQWQDSDGIDRYTTEIISNDFVMLGKRPNGDARAANQAGSSGSPRAPNAGQGDARRPAGPPPGPPDDFDDDIPF